MSEFLINPQQEKSGSKAEERFFDTNRIPLIGIVAAVAWIGGYLGSEFRPLPSLLELAGNLSVLAVSCIVAIGLMRSIEVISFRREIRRRAKSSNETSVRIREILAERSPAGDTRANEIDASLLLDRLLNDSSGPSKDGNSERASGA